MPAKPQAWFFDNLVVQQYPPQADRHGPLVQEEGYYPFGLSIAGLSSKAFGRLDNKKKFNGYEENKDLGVNWLESFYRTYDPQLGRFWQVDPEPKDDESLYAGLGNNPVNYVDPLGNDWWDALMATVISVADNVMGTNMRSTYQPHDAADYNNALRTADNAMLAVGAAMTVVGGNMINTGVRALMAGPEAAPVTITTVVTGVVIAGTGMLIAGNAANNISKGYNYGIKPNEGISPKHGSTEHNNAIEKKIKELQKDKSNQNIRKNQTQHNYKEQKVGPNRPDLQWDSRKTKKHHNWEVDKTKRNSVKHKKQIERNDKESINTFTILPPKPKQ